MPKVVPEYTAQARARIIDAAAAVFRRRGLPGGTMAEIAREIGVSKGALYLYFPTKARLLGAVQAKFREQYLAVLEARLRTGDVAEGLVGTLERVLSRDFDPAVWHQLVVEASADPEVRKVLRIDARADRANVKRLLQRLEAEGRVAPMRDAAATADAVLLLLQGTLSAVYVQGSPQAARAQLLRSLRLVLGARPAAPPERPSRPRKRA